MAKDILKPPTYVKRWRKIDPGVPSYDEGYRWFDVKTMKHFKKLLTGRQDLK